MTAKSDVLTKIEVAEAALKGAVADVAALRARVAAKGPRAAAGEPETGGLLVQGIKRSRQSERALRAARKLFEEGG